MKDQILFITDDISFLIGRGFIRFRIKTNDQLPYNVEISVPTCVILVSSAFEENGVYYPQTELKYLTYENEDY